MCKYTPIWNISLHVTTKKTIKGITWEHTGGNVHNISLQYGKYIIHIQYISVNHNVLANTMKAKVEMFIGVPF